MEHTKGEWVGGAEMKRPDCMVLTKDGVPVAEVACTTGTPKNPADLKLIIAAPKMLESLESVAYWLSDANNPCCFPRNALFAGIEAAKLTPTDKVGIKAEVKEQPIPSHIQLEEQVRHFLMLLEARQVGLSTYLEARFDEGKKLYDALGLVLGQHGTGGHLYTDYQCDKCGKGQPL